MPEKTTSAAAAAPGRREPGILLLYSRGVAPNPTTVAHSIECFAEHSRFPVWPVDVYYGFPLALGGAQPQVIVLHHTVFYDSFGRLGQRFLEFLDRRRKSYLVAMFQDEQAVFDKIAPFCREFAVDCLYTMFEPQVAEEVYGKTVPGARVVSHLPGYVSDELRDLGARLAIPDAERPIDIGYRGRRPPAEWGAAVLEKYEIAVEFKRRAAGSSLRLDIETDEEQRIYGQDWYRFLANSRATLGTESGTEIESGGVTLPYRTIGPRHLEAGALKSCQILFEGHYSGLLEPMVHYIPLRKDFSNFEEVLTLYDDPQLRQRLSGNTFRDVISDRRASYEGFIEAFDAGLGDAGLSPTSAAGSVRMSMVVHSPRPMRRLLGLITRLRPRMRWRKLRAAISRRRKERDGTTGPTPHP